jgi:hypothetical protein
VAQAVERLPSKTQSPKFKLQYWRKKKKKTQQQKTATLKAWSGVAK